MKGSRGSFAGSATRLLLAIAALAAITVFATFGPARAADAPTITCTAGESRVIEVGLVKASGCWTETTEDGATIYTARFADQPGRRIDMNGFILTTPYSGDGAIRIDAKRNRV